MNKIIVEGGGAIVPLIGKLASHPDNKIRDLYVGKVTDAELDNIFPDKYGVFPKENDQSYVGRLLHFLGNKGLIDIRYSPKFLLGSTRLAALKNYGKEAVWTDKLETDDIIQVASGKKTEFGDLDVDIVYKVNKNTVVNAINSFDPSTYAARTTNDVNVAIRIGDKVVQIDLVDVSRSKDTSNFLQKSGFLDLSSNVKGVFSIYLLRSAVSNMDISPTDALDAVLSFANKNPKSSFSISLQKKIQNGYVPAKVRFSLGSEGLKLTLDIIKRDGEKEQIEKLDFDLNPRADYKNLDILAQQILQNPSATSSDIFHAISLAKFIRQHKADKVQQIWEDFVKIAEKKIKNGVAEEDYKTGMDEIKKVLGLTQKTTIKEGGREAIGRFEGKNQFSNSSLFELLHNIVVETKNEGKEQFQIDLKNNRTVDMIEKTDSMFCNFGVDRNNKFFMESSNSGPVYENNVRERFGFSTDFLSSFKSLNENTRFQTSLKKLFKSIGPFKFDAEIFPVLTHQGSDTGDITFVATKYKREKFGKDGGFVIFKSWLWNDNNLGWFRPDPDKNTHILGLVRHEADSSGWSSDWKIYTNETDMKIPGVITISLGRYLSQYLASPHMYERGQLSLQSRARSSEKDQIILELTTLRGELQSALDDFANNAHSVLGSKNSPIEGVILRIKTSDGNFYEVKGTSEVFNSQREILWYDRTAILNLENDFESKFIKNVLGLKTAQPAALNKLISSAADEFMPKSNGTTKKIDFIHFLLPRMVSGDVDFDMTKSSAMSLLDETERVYDSLLKNFEVNEPSMDADSVRKTKEFFSAFQAKFDTYKTLVRSNLNGSEYYVRVLDNVIGFRIDKFLNTTDPATIKEDQKREKVLIWSGRAQPWHKGHDAMISKGKTLLEKFGATKILLMIIKGAESSKNKDENPLNEKEQVALLYSIYKNDPQVEIYSKFPKSGYLMELMEHISTTGYSVVGWLAGSDRIADYKKAIRAFNPSKFLEDHEYSPILLDETGDPVFQMIEAPRIMSGTETRNSAKQLDFKQWLTNIAPENIDSSAVRVYKTIYGIIRNEQPDTLAENNDPEVTEEKLVEDLVEFFENEELNEISAMGAGAVQGSFGEKNMDREAFIQELKLRKFIKDAIRLQKEEMSKQNLSVLEEEQKLRSFIKTLLLKEAEEDRPHQSTGINVLSDLLKKIVPVIEIDYKKMTSHPGQRQSFRAHILKASTTALATENSNDNADTESKTGDAIEDSNDVEISLEEEDVIPQVDPEQEKFIDIERPSQKKAKQKKPDPKKEFGIEGEDETGRNIAMSTFDKIETSIMDSYSILSDQEDKRLFFDYLVVNLKLYFDRFEQELEANIQEPDSQIYDQEKESGV